MIDSDSVALVGVDWGTSSLRVTAMDVDGAVLAEVSNARGILTVQADEFSAVFDSVIAPWSLAPTVPVVLSGMVTSRNGWHETPYLNAPCHLAELAEGLVSHQGSAGRRLYFVPGVQQLDAVTADVMRGEETELFGWLARTPPHQTEKSAPSGQRLFLLPGTHSKWVRTDAAGIKGFKTCMTGELFALLCEHSILGRLMTSDRPASATAFTEGAKRGLAEPQSLLSMLFSARAMPLLEVLPTDDVQDYLAGMLIGAEVAAQPDANGCPVVVIGRGDLTDRYISVLQMAGSSTEKAEPGAAYAGQFELAKRAELF